MMRIISHMFNMFVMKKEWVDKYCTWLFDILSQLEKRIDLRGMDSFQARLFGRVSELLLDVWIEANQLKYKEIKYVPIGPYHFWKKVGAFLNAKLYGKQYNASV